MTETKPSGLLINLALLPFALVGVLILGTCGLCVMAGTLVHLAPETAQSSSPAQQPTPQADYLKEHGYK